VGRVAFTFAPEHVARMGTVSDWAVAREAGCCRATVCAYRKKHGIPMSPRLMETRKVAYARFLGLVPDTAIAEAFGVTKQAVNRARAVRGIVGPASSFSMEVWQMLFSVIDNAEVGAARVTIPRSVYEDIVAAAVQKKEPQK